MSMSPIILTATYAALVAPAAAHYHQQQKHEGHAYVPPSPENMHGTYSFTDLAGRRTSAADFTGRWTLLFFGYSRCTSSCPVAIPKIVSATQELRRGGVPAQAVFVDIDVPPLAGITIRRSGEVAGDHEHSHMDMNRNAAMRTLSKQFGGDLVVLSGSRGQINAATRGFRVAREHTPPRKGEEGHSINHSSMIYFISPEGKVAGYGYHDAKPSALVEMVTKLSKAQG